MTAKLADFSKLNQRYGWYRFDLTSPAQLHNQAGQYLMIEVGENTMRAYSMCDRPDLDSSFEIILDYRPNGIGVNYIRNLKFGDQINCLGPLGQLCVAPEHGDGRLFLLATGSGMSPLHAITIDQLQLQQTRRELYFFWGANNSSEFFWLDDFQDLQKSFPNFHFIPTISDPDDSWTLERGYVTDQLRGLELLPSDHFYLCGNPAMINSTIDYLCRERGLDKTQITTEQFSAPASR